MKCHDAKRRLDLFMDGELTVPENLQVLEHLNLCRPCAGVYEGEKALRAQLKAQLGAEKAPRSLYDRLARVSAPAGEAPRRRWGALAAAAFFVTLAAALLFTPPAEMPRLLAAEVSAKHDETRDGFCGHVGADRMCVCVNCSPERGDSMGRFFKRHVPYDVCAHDLAALGYAFAGAAVWEHRGAKVCWTIQQDGKGHAVTHALVATPLARSDAPIVLREGPHPVVMKSAGAPGMTCVFIFDDSAEADRFLMAMGMKK